MNYLSSDKNTLIWLIFTIYTVSALFIIPNAINFKLSTTANDASNDRAIAFASGLLLRIALVIPMIFIVKNTI